MKQLFLLYWIMYHDGRELHFRFGIPNQDIFTNFGDFIKENAASFVFNLVFCATVVTIVSGSIAEKTKFVSYCIYLGIISFFVYPVEGGWIWNSQGWLAQLGFHDFAGSAAIHSVGDMAALIGAIRIAPAWEICKR